jgi:PPIC-type PPIASE domain
MCKSWLMCVLLGTLGWGQAAPPKAAPAQSPAPAANQMNEQPPTTEKDSAASVPATAAVLTIDGVCEPQAKAPTAKGAAAKPASAPKAGTNCRTVITKAQFEQLANNLAPNITPQMKKQLASVLPRLMAMSNEAKKEGLENTPQYKERVKFNRMQILAQQLQQKLQDQAADVPQADIEKYYKEHPETFEQYSLDRLFVPRTKQVEAEAKQEGNKESKASGQEQKDKEAAEKARQGQGEQAMTTLAEDLRARALAGEDFLKLQKEAFEAAGMKIESPTVTLPSIRRSGLPPAHAAVFALKPGDVSEVISDNGGHYIYKMNNKSEMTLEQAKTEIHSKLQNDRMHEEMDKLNNSFKVETNEAYFGPGGANAMPPRPTRPRPGMPPAGASGTPQTPPPAPGANPQ